jgi:putative ABC transport system ATP-binding protein
VSQAPSAVVHDSESEGNPADVVLEVSGLVKVFGDGPSAVRAVDGVDLRVRRGELLLVMGPSGSGKTTLLTMIGGLLKPTSGAVRIDGYDITSMKESELPKVRRHLVGFVFQTFNLLESLSAAENVEIALNLAGESGRQAREKAERLLTDLGLGTRLEFKPHALSGGEKQRVSIARALANDPQILLADEPTANLDSKHGHEVVVLLRDIAREQNRSVVIVSHDHRIREVADRVLWLEDGRIKDIGKLARDPVCGMTVEELGSLTYAYEGRTYHFCANGCRRDFIESPDRFVGRDSGAASSAR